MLPIGSYGNTSALAEMGSYVATPIARQLLRLVRSDKGSSEEFNAATYLAEVVLKYETTCIISVLRQYDAGDAASVGYNLVARESLGQWADTLKKALSALTAIGASETLWYTKNFSQKLPEPSGSVDPVDDVIMVLNELGQSDYRLTKSRLGLLEFFVTLRNRTRGHGAPLQRQYEVINDAVVRLLEVVCSGSPFLQRPLLLPTRLKAGAYNCRVLIGATPQDHRTLPAECIPNSSALYIDVEGTLFELPDFLRYFRDDDGCFFLNSPRKKNGTFDFLDYYTNQQRRDSVVAFATPPSSKPKSSTAGIEQLDTDTLPAHNLPPVDFLTYVPRPELENDLDKMIRAKTMNVVSLGGEGGIGKTTLALRVTRALLATESEQDDGRFDYIIWFSARDIDLDESRGPLRRERQVSSLETCAQFFKRLMASVEDVPPNMDDVQFFGHALSSEKWKFLLIFDNFESFDDTGALQTFLNDNLVFPSKVLITSRERNFEGDRQLRVPGLAIDQARDLIVRTARQVGCEPAVLDDKRVVTIHNRTSGNPYAIKLVVNELASGTAFERIFERALNERYLTTLFRRSFERTEDESQYLFLLLCLCPAVRDERWARLFCVGRGYEYDKAKDTLVRHSLLDPPARTDGSAVYRISWAAEEFARQSLVSANSHRAVEDDVSLADDLAFRGLLTATSREIYEFLSGTLDRGGSLQRERRILEYLAATDPEASAFRALLYCDDPAISAAEKRTAFGRAVELDSSNGDVWFAWSKFEESSKELRRSLDLALNAVDYGDTAEMLGLVGRHIIHVLSEAKEQIPMQLRKVYTGSIIDRLDRFRDELGCGDLVTLGWLHLISGSRHAAADVARLALDRDCNDPRAKDLLLRSSAGKDRKIGERATESDRRTRYRRP